MPAAPFRRLLEKHSREVVPDGHDENLPGTSALADMCGLPQRRIWGILNGQETIAFDVADKIVTRLVGPMLWWEDEELNEIYMSVDLRKLDFAYPVSDSVARKLQRLVNRAIELYGTRKAVALAFGISTGTVQKVSEGRSA